MAGGAAPKLKALETQETQRRLSREQLLQPRIREEETEIEGLGGTVVLRSLSYAARAEIRSKTGWNTEEYDDDAFTMLAIVHSVVDPKLTEADIDALKEQDQSIFDSLVLKITLLNMMGRTGDLKKESEPIGSSDSV